MILKGNITLTRFASPTETQSDSWGLIALGLYVYNLSWPRVSSHGNN